MPQLQSRMGLRFYLHQGKLPFVWGESNQTPGIKERHGSKERTDYRK